MLSLLIGAHLIGDFLLQNHWMQTKSKSHLTCSVHVACYSLPFLVLVGMGMLSSLLLLAILAQHWLQDRYALHLKWMTLFQQTSADKWPVGPLCVDQSIHIGFLWVLVLLQSL